MRLRVAALALAASGAALGLPQMTRPQQMDRGLHGISAPLWLARPALVGPPPEDHEPRRIALSVPAAPVNDPVVQRSVAALLSPPLGLTFEGVGLGTVSVPSAQAFEVTGDPSDPSGDVGPNHYVQMVNSSFAVFAKTGTLLLGPMPTQTAFAGLGGACASGIGFDGVVLYDPLADRWLITQLAFFEKDRYTGPFWECVAVSRTPDPTGQYAQYGFQYANFNDYPKLGVWPDAYYATYNVFGNAAVTSRLLARRICAFDRTRMLAGEPTSPQQCVDITSEEVSGLAPADVDGDLRPPAGEPAPSVGFFHSDSLVLYRFHVDWSAVENSSIDAVLIGAAGFQALCITRSPYCVPQLRGPVLDGLGDRMMFRVAYRNMGAYESLIANHNVSTGTSAGVRWYEIRDPAGDPFVYQQGTYAPDSNSRWVGSAAMDRGGNIGLGFSISGAQQNVAIGITGRTPADPPGVMGQGETVIPASGAEESVRWGDYSSLSVDPSDDCTFWYTAQYIPFDGARNWRTRVTTFQLPGCAAAPDFAVWMPVDPASVMRGRTTTFVLSTAALRSSAAARTIQLAVPPQLGPGVSATITPLQVSPGEPATVTIAADASAPIGEVPFTVQASAAGVTLSASATAVVIDSDFAITVDKPNTTLGAAGKTELTVSVTPVFGEPEVVIFSATSLPRWVQATFDPVYVRVGGSTTLHLTGAPFLSPGATSIKVRAAGSLMTRSTVIHLRTLLQPVVHILDPRPYSNVTGIQRVAVTAGASTGTTLKQIELYLDDQKIQGLQASTSPAELLWNTNAFNDGPHYLSARATDADGNQGSSPGVAVWIQNAGFCGCSSDAGGWEALALFGLLAATRRRKR